MAVLSVCRNLAVITRQVTRPQLVQARQSGGHVLEIKPSNFQWYKFKDLLHWYLALGFIPSFMFSSYMNLFVGSAELAEIPEGYTPQYFEYEKHPVTRFFCKYLMKSPQELYELRMSTIYIESENVLMRRIDRQVSNVMRARNDYRAWYFHPVYGKVARQGRELSRMWQDERTGTKDPVPLHESGGLAEFKFPRD